ncbi:virulence-associated E family protein [Luminiphilus sp.]|nr:primase-helicase family protein [Luminiphilus sp.]MDA9711424.1 virulence-associated E family protein [Luminiphilus sp.]
MDPDSDYKKALDRLIERFSIFKKGGPMFFLDNDNVAEVQNGNGNPLTNKLEWYTSRDIKTQQGRMLEASDFALHDTDYAKLHNDWLRSPRTKYFTGIDFNPESDDPATLNLWRGSIQGCEGDCEFLIAFLREVICNGSQEKFDYLIRYLAHAMQMPQEKPEIMIVLSGSQGIGKGSFFKLLRRIWPYTTLFVQDVNDIVGRNNACLENSFIVTIDEGFWHGDRASASRLKSLITEDWIRIEEKYQPKRTVTSCQRFFAATNEQKFGHTEPGSRRFLFMQVSDLYKQDTNYFAKFNEVLDDGIAVPALVHMLRSIDLSDFQVRHRPLTSEHADQVLKSLEPLWKFMIDSLIKKSLRNHTSSLAEDWTDAVFWTTERIKEELFVYHPYANRYGEITDKFIVAQLKKMFPSLKSNQRKRDGATQHRGFILPDIETARREMLNALEIDERIVDWTEPDLIRSGLVQNRGTSVTSGTEHNKDLLSHLPRLVVAQENPANTGLSEA